MKVLIAEDDLVSGLVLERTLQRWGYEVIKTKNGVEAWECFQAEPVSLVITDWMMPQMDGVELCRRIRQHRHEHYTYVMLLSAKSQKIEMVEGMSAGADDFMTKPFDSAELQVRLRAGERLLNLEQSLTERKAEIEAVNRELQRSIECQRLINQLLGSLTSSLDFEAVLPDAVVPLQALFESSRAYFRLVDRETQSLRLAAEKCAPGIAQMGAVSFPIETAPEAEEIAYNSALAVPHLSQALASDPHVSLRMLAKGFGVGALLSEPLTMQGMWFGDIGVQQCGAEREWTEDEVHLLKTLAQQISVVAVNAALHRKVQEQSVRDALTGLFNRRYFDEAFAIEFERASRYNQPLSIVMVDLDHLKIINDTMGHLAGDAAIQMTGETLLRQSRRVDIATRYGGEEFVVILPQTAMAGGKAASEHWRQAIHQCVVGEHRLSASLGVASFPEHGTTPERLLKAADIAMYRAKHEGRNRVCVASFTEVEARNAEV
jgi:two-component system cell cycle response regulator